MTFASVGRDREAKDALAVAATLAAMLLSSPSLLGCSSIVGGECRPGTVVCAGRCVDLSSDVRSCGACGLECAEGERCAEGRCALGPTDAGPSDDAPWLVDAAGDAGIPTRDASSDAGPGLDAEGPPRDGGIGADGSSDGGHDGDGATSLDAGGGLDGGNTPPCDLGELECADLCVDVRTDPTSCGACGVRCAAAQFCEAGVCVDDCGPGTTRCGRACISLDSDPDNCGACGRRCDSGICEHGMCSGRLAGHLVVVGHDYVTARPSMDRVVGNAVLLASSPSVEVLAWRGAASAASVAGTERAVNSIASTMSRSVSWTQAVDAAAVTALLENADVFLVHAQAGGTDAALETLGVQWSRALDTFLARGGIVVSLETMAPHRGTWVILEAAGLASASRTEEATGALISVVAPADALAVGVPLTYRGERLSVRLLGADLPVVASDPVGAIVLHRTVVGP